MCGITGFWNFNRDMSGEQLESILRPMTDQIAHRGPDGDGFWAEASSGIALGHRRLAIVDLSPAGHQPMVSACGRYIMSYNGEVYNAEELRRDLPGRSWRGHSDTEVMLEACAAWGVQAAVSKFIGMFAFALFDRHDQVLYLVRDRLGIKPLYWGIHNNHLIFGSELKCFHQHPRFHKAINQDVLSSYFRYNYIPTPLCIFRHTHKLEQGTILEIRGPQEITKKAFWSLKESVANSLDVRRTHQPTLDELKNLLRDAVQRRMIADVPLGAFLSGGVDSSLVVAMMQEQSSQPIKTFTIGFHEKEYDESPYAKAVAQHLGTDHHAFDLPVDKAADIIPSLSTWFDEPFADSSQIPTYLVSHLARQHVTVALSGDGGDELFAGYNRYLFVERWWKMLRILPQPLRQGFSQLLLYAPENLWQMSERMLGSILPVNRLPQKVQTLSRVLPQADLGELYISAISMWKDPVALVPQAMEVLDQRHTPMPTLSGVEYMQYLDTQYYLPDDILTKVDRTSMALGLEARVPLLDHRVVAMAWQFSIEQKIHKGVTKNPLRQVLYDYVPASLIERPKMGFGVPLGQWLRGQLRDWCEDLLSKKSLEAGGFLNVDMVQEAWLKHVQGVEDQSPALWGVLMFQDWQRKWMVS